MSTLAERVARLEAIEAIRELKARYCSACDDGHDPDAVTALFAPDGIWEQAGGRPRRGHHEIRQAFAGLRESCEFSQHNVTNLSVDVAPDLTRARGRWHFMGILQFRGRPPLLGMAHYDEVYVRQDDRWLFQHVRATTLATARVVGLERS